MTQIITTSSTVVGQNITAASADEFIYIAEGVTRASINGFALLAGVGGVQVEVLGSLVGSVSLNDEADGDGRFQVTVGSTGSMVGGIFLVDANDSLTNLGEITGFGPCLQSTGDHAHLTNTGTITGHGGGGFSAVFSNGSGSEIVNYGLIQELGADPREAAVDFSDTQPGGAVSLTNYGNVFAASGIAIRGDTDGVDRISNFGTIDGDVLQSGGNDFFRNGGQVLGDAGLGAGDDQFKGQDGTVEGVINGGAGNDTVLGGGSDDVILGGAGSDVLRGGSGDDTINGGNEADRMTGGESADTFDFDSVTDSGALASRDTITDFQTGLDLIDLSSIDADTLVGGNQAFAFIGSDAFSGSGQVRATQSGGNTIVQLNTDGDIKAEMTFTLLGLHTLSASDFIL